MQLVCHFEKLVGKLAPYPGKRVPYCGNLAGKAVPNTGKWVAVGKPGEPSRI